jgi:hypothetical protein
MADRHIFTEPGSDPHPAEELEMATQRGPREIIEELTAVLGELISRIPVDRELDEPDDAVSA